MLARMRPGLALSLLLASCSGAPPAGDSRPTETPPPGGLQLSVKLAVETPPATGRLLFLIAPASSEDEPRLQVSDQNDSAQLFGVDVTDWRPGQARAIEGDVAGYPLAALADLPAGDYKVQALLHRYEVFRRADGHVVSLPPDRGEGQQWSLAPGNLVSTPRVVRIDPTAGGSIELTLDHALELPPAKKDPSRLRRVKIKSELLTRFWGREVTITALVLLPAGWENHPEARYPLIVSHGHFSADLSNYREEPPDPKLPPVDRAGLDRECASGHEPGCAKHGYRRLAQEEAHRFARKWAGKGFPRVLLVELQHANPYYDDSYAVNSANLGPYGDAITREVIPYLEKEFRGLGPWARGLYGGSTGGWEAMAAQVFYPDEYNGAIVACPDPLDFRAYTTFDIYADDNAYHVRGPFRTTPRAGARNADGTLRTTMEQFNQMELALGTRSRSGNQYDIWEAVYSPVGPDGYPQRIFDKKTGVIDKRVAAHWRDHYDIGHILTRDWATLGPKLAGKLHIYVGNMDTYYLDRSVRLLEERLRAVSNPKSDVVFAYGARDGHCWSGDHERPNFRSRLTYHERFIPKLVAHFLKTAPRGADTRSWRY